MSIQFNDTTNLSGLVQIYEKEAGFQYGDVSGNTTRLKEFTAEANIAQNELLTIAIKSNKQWQVDDTNHTGDDEYGIMLRNIVSGTRNYSIIEDAESNLVLDILAIYVKQTASGPYVKLDPVDMVTSDDVVSFYNGLDEQGPPVRYDKMAGVIMLDPVPNYNSTNGLKIIVNREATKFTTSDTTKRPGLDPRLDRYCAIKPAYTFARVNSLSTKDDLAMEVAKLERLASEIYASRAKDERPIIRPMYQNNR